MSLASGRRYWLHALLFAATMATTTITGARMAADFRDNLPFPGLEGIWQSRTAWLANPTLLLDGLPFSLALMAILLAHELGHYLACVYYKLDASLPYFLPAPVITGTFGAFIRIRSAIYSKRALFDVAIAGPLAGFAVLVPVMIAGLAMSKVLPGINAEGALRFGDPPLLVLMARAIFDGVAMDDLYLHPVARAAVIGMLATAWNLIPIGQLDGGHILYAVKPQAHRVMSLVMVASLVCMGYFWWWGWYMWAVPLFFGRKHPSIHDPEEIGGLRVQLAVVALMLFALCFTPIPIDLR